MSIASPQVSIILPCFNEGLQIASSLSRLDAWFGSAAEVLVVDDGSTDETSERAEAYSRNHPPVRVHRLPVHAGKGAAIQAAIPLARGPLVLLLDADLAYDRDSVQRVLTGLETADMVVGNRRHYDSRYSVPVRLFGFLYRRHVVGMAFNACVRTLLPLELRDTQCGLKGFRREALHRIAAALSTTGFTLDVEMLLVAQALGLRLIDVPVCVTYHSAKSSIKLLESSVTMGAELVRIAVRHARGRYASERL
jgi:glycosyltransferase involved in cell wall biosynthesis